MGPITKGFPGIPASVDTAFVWGGNGKIYFFKGGNYWKFDPERKPHVREDIYPKKISSWDLPSGIDAALQWNNGRTYFFKKGQYWRFNDREFTIDRANPPSLEMPATGGLDALRLVDSLALCPSTRVSLEAASSLPRMRRKTHMALSEMKTSTWRVV